MRLLERGKSRVLFGEGNSGVSKSCVLKGPSLLSSPPEETSSSSVHACNFGRDLTSRFRIPYPSHHQGRWLDTCSF